MWWWAGKGKVTGEGRGPPTRRACLTSAGRGFVGFDVNNHIFASEKLPKRVYSKAWERPSLRNHKNKAEIQVSCDGTCTAEVE